MVEVRGLFLLDLVFEDADIFVLCNFDREYISRVTKNEAVEQKIRGTHCE